MWFMKASITLRAQCGNINTGVVCGTDVGRDMKEMGLWDS